MSVENILLKNVLNNNTLYEVYEDDNNELQYKLEDGEKIRICEIKEVNYNSIKLYPNTKDKTIEFIAKKRMGTSEVKENFLASDLVNWYSIDDLTNIKDLYINEPNTKIKISQNEVNKHFSVLSDKRRPIEKGNILVSFKMTIGITKIYNSDKPSYCNEAIDIINIVDKKKYDNKYLSLLIGKEYLKYVQINVGSTTLNDKLKDKIYIKIPTYENINTLLIQKSIAKNIEDKLDDIDRRYKILDTINILNKMQIDILIKNIFNNNSTDTIFVNNHTVELQKIKFNNIKLYPNTKDKTIEFIAKKRMGTSEVKENFLASDLVNWYSIDDLTNIKDLYINEPNTKIKISQNEVNKHFSVLSDKRRPIEKGNILVSFKMTIGITKIYNSDKPSYCNEAIDIINIVDKKKYDNKYLSLLIGKEYLKYVQINVGSTTLNDKLKDKIYIKIPTYKNINSYDLQLSIQNYLNRRIMKIKKRNINTNNMKEVLKFAKGKVWIF